MNVNPGMLNKKIIIETLSSTVDAIGQQVTAWSEYAECWAGVNGLVGSEYWAAKAQQSEETVVFTIRYNEKLKVLHGKDVTQSYRIVFSGQIYDIQHVDNPFFSNEMLKIKAVSNG